MPLHSLLLIDDDLQLAKMIELILGLAGETCTLHYANDGETGVQLAQQVGPQLILLDFQMPGMDGFDTLQALRADARAAHIPVIAISGAIATRGRCAEMIARSQAYLPKPLDLERLVDLLRQLIVVESSGSSTTLEAHRQSARAG